MEGMLWLCLLCGKRARMLCESDEAKLCSDCDHKVHCANFLVEKHLRILLCRLCQSPTPWKACGPSLTPTSSLCYQCSLLPTQTHNNNRQHYDDDDDKYYYDVPENEDEEEEGENQVVPWCSSSPSPSLSSSNDADADISSAATDSASASASDAATSHSKLKRSSFHDYNDEVGCSSSEALFRPWKQSRTRIHQRERLAR